MHFTEFYGTLFHPIVPGFAELLLGFTEFSVMLVWFHPLPSSFT